MDSKQAPNYPPPVAGPIIRANRPSMKRERTKILAISALAATLVVCAVAIASLVFALQVEDNIRTTRVQHAEDVTQWNSSLTAESQQRLQSSQRQQALLAQEVSRLDTSQHLVNSSLSVSLGRLQVSHEQEKSVRAGQVSSLNSTLDTKTSALNQDLDTEKSVRAGQVSSLNSTLDSKTSALNQDLDTEKSVRAGQVSSLNSTLDTKTSALRQELDTQVSSLNSTLDSKTSALHQELDTQLSSLNSSMLSEIDSLKSEKAAILARLGFLECQASSCVNHGSCLSNGTCECPIGWVGTLCDLVSWSSVTPVKLVDPDGAAFDYLGYGGVTLSADGLTLVAASYGDDDKGSSSGSILVWTRSSTSTAWSSVTPVKLVDPDGDANDYLGRGGVTLSADSLTLVAASYADADKGSDSGSILVWTRASTSTAWSSVTPVKLVDPDGAADDKLGFGGVSLSADSLTLAAASYADDDKGSASGSILVWTRASTSTAWSSVTPVKLVDPDGAASDQLGFGGVTLSADGLTLAAASYGDDDKGSDSGSILVWTRSSTSTAWSSVTPVKLVDPDGATYDTLGYGGVTLSADGLTLVAASYGDDDKGSASGSILVWTRSSTSTAWSTVTPVKLVDPDGAADDYLGFGGVTLSADGLTLAAASHRDADKGSDSGSILVFEAR